MVDEAVAEVQSQLVCKFRIDTGDAPVFLNENSATTSESPAVADSSTRVVGHSKALRVAAGKSGVKRRVSVSLGQRLFFNVGSALARAFRSARPTTGSGP